MNKKYDFKINAIVVEKNYAPIYEAVIHGDDSGEKRKAVLYARGNTWTERFQNQSLVTIIDRDGELEFTIHKSEKDSIKFDLNIGELADLRALVEVLNRTYENLYFNPLKISSVKETRRTK